MIIKFNTEKLLKPDTFEIKKGTLKHIDSLKRMGYGHNRSEVSNLHKIYADSYGRKYYEIFANVKTQVFVSNLLSDFNTHPVFKYKEQDGKTIYLSAFPSEEDLKVDTAGDINGWANLILLGALFSDTDHSFGLPTLEFNGEGDNTNIVMGNILIYDFGEAFQFESSDDYYKMKKELSSCLETCKNDIKSNFDLSKENQRVDHESFYLNVLIHARANLERLEEHINKIGIVGINSLLRKSGAKKMKTIFPGLRVDYSAEDFQHDLLLKIKILDNYLYREMNK